MPETSRFFVLVLILVGASAPFATAQEPSGPIVTWRNLEGGGGRPLEYALVTPSGFDASKPHPVLIALPPGRQDRAMVDAGIARYWGSHAADRGFVVASPILPRTVDPADLAAYLEPMLRALRIELTLEGSRFHLAGASNGGRSAFRLATARAFEFQSLVVLPGYPDDGDVGALGTLRDLTVRMFVGGDDTRWVESTESARQRLLASGVEVRSQVFPGEGHVPASLDGGALMDVLVGLRANSGATDPAVAAIQRTLHDFHDAAAKADASRYFAHFTPDAVFLGTDATERWTLAEFQVYAKQPFLASSAWIFVPQRQNVVVFSDGLTACFDESLGSGSYGPCRGSGVLRRSGDRWRVAQYHLTIPVPNELAHSVVGLIRRGVPGLTPRRFVVVRHAEKADDSRDSALSDVGRTRARWLERFLVDVPIAALHCSEFRRTRETLEPLSSRTGLSIQPSKAAESRALGRRLLVDAPEGTTVIAGHSNTVPLILLGLGVKEAAKLTIDESEYDHVFLVEPGADGSRMVHVRMPPSP